MIASSQPVRLILASSSAYRRDLLSRLQLPFAAIAPDLDETALPGETPQATALRLAQAKAAAVAASNPNSLVIGSDQVATLDRAALERTEYKLLSRGPDGFASPAGLLAGYMARPRTACESDVAWVCICISDWAVEHGARKTALQFAMAAAFAWPRHARYAWTVARMLRAQNQMQESEAWFRRAHRVAIWSDDWEAQARVLNSLGNLHRAVGRFPLAKRLNLRARRVARRHALTTLEAEVTHDLFITAAEMKAFDQAEAFAKEAFSLYGRAHPRLLMLMHDVAQSWVGRGLYARALPVLTALLRKFTEPAERIRALAAASRAAGALRLREAFECCWADFWETANAVTKPDVLASTLCEVGLGAADLEQWERAASTLELAREHANAAGNHDVSMRADSALTLVHARRIIKETVPRCTEASDDMLARGFLMSLGTGEPMHQPIAV